MAGVRPRARDIGIEVGVFRPGPLNAITDVPGVRVGQVTLIEGDDVRTGVTAILPHGGNLHRDRVPAGAEAGNGYGKLAGYTQIAELGEIETPIILTNTLNVAEGIAAVVEWTLAYPGNEQVRTVNAVVGETNDGMVNNIRLRRVSKEHVLQAIGTASCGQVDEGSVGAGTGTHAFKWKGGIGSSSRILPAALGGYALGVLVQTNFGGILSIDGVPVGRELGQFLFSDELRRHDGDGSIMVVIATDAPISDRNAARLARRGLLGIGRTGGPMANNSGDYVLAFSAGETVRRTPERREGVKPVDDLGNDSMTALFQAAIEATEEAIYNALLKATTVHGNGSVLHALPLDQLLPLLRRYRAST